MQRTSTFEAAQTLAEFAGLSPTGVDAFRTSHRGFVPKVWWEYRLSDGRLLWQVNQGFLREAWGKHFDIGQFELMRLLTSVFDPASMTDVMFRTKNRPAFATVQEMPEELYPYQQAVLFLKEQNWRTRFCERCGSSFVAGHNQQTYCGNACSSESRKKQRREDHQRHLDVRNRKKREAYARRKAKTR